MVIDNLMRSPAIITGEMSYKENSKILRMFTRDYGRLSVLAQGVNKPNHKLFSLAHRFVEGQFEIRPGHSFHYLQDGQIIEMHYPLRKDIYKLSCANLICEALEKALDERQVENEIFTLTIQALTVMEYIKPQLVALVFLLHLMSISGFRPRFSHCVGCQTRHFKRMGFSIIDGGILCENCMDTHHVNILLTQDLYFTFHDLTCASFVEAIEIDLTSDELRMLFNLSVDLFEHHFQTSLKSKDMITRLAFV